MQDQILVLQTQMKHFETT